MSINDYEFDSAALGRLNLSVAGIHQKTAAVPCPFSSEPLEINCAECSTMNSKKRWSPSPSFQEPSKRSAPLPPPDPPAAAAENNDMFFGFTKLPIPVTFPNVPSSPLRRTFSEPVHSPTSLNNLAAPSSQIPAQISKPPSQEGPLIANVEQPSWGILRTASDPTPIANLQLANAHTPPRPPPPRKNSKSPQCSESTSTKRYRRMKDQLRMMNQWCNHVMSGVEEEEGDGTPDFNTDKILKDSVEEDANETEKSPEESVWVEKNGSCLILHFKCPCGNGYQILLNGSSCYYKLTSF